MKIALWGAGGHGGVVLDAVRQQGKHEPVVFVDDRPAGEKHHRSGLPIYGRDSLPTLRAQGVSGIVVAIGDEVTRIEMARIASQAGFELCTVIHPAAVICPDVRIGAGAVLFAGAVVQTGTEIGKNVIINTSASVDHDCVISDGVQIAPRATLGGRVKVNALSFIGIGAIAINSVVLGRHCLIGAGAVVVRDIPDNSVAYGVPARIIRQREAI